MASFTIDDNGTLTGISLANDETDVTLPSAVRIVGEKVFTKEVCIRRLVLNTGCERIRSRAFWGNATLQSLRIGSGFLYFEHDLFAYGNPLISIEVDAGNSAFKVIDGCLLDYEGKTLYLGTNSSGIVVPESVVRIAPYAFAGCRGLKAIAFPDGLTTIADYAFCDCIAMEEVAFPTSVSEIGIGAFFGCSGVKTCRIGTTGTILGDDESLAIIGKVFANNSRLNLVKIPGYVNEIGDAVGETAFHDCHVIDQCIIDGPDYAPEKGRLPLANSYPNGTKPITLTFDPDGGKVEPATKDVYYGSPYGVLPEPYGKSGYDFVGWYYEDELITADKVNYLSVPHSVKAKWTVVYYHIVFYDMSGEVFYELTLPFGAEFHIPSETPINPENPDAFVFQGWYKEGSSEIIDGTSPLVVDGDMSFYPRFQATDFFKVYINEGKAEIAGIYEEVAAADVPIPLVIPSTISFSGETYPVTRIGDFSFQYDQRINKVKIEEGIEYIGTSAFRDTPLEEISLPNSLRTIGNYAFYNSNLLFVYPTSIETYDQTYLTSHWIIPEGVEYIGERAFSELSSYQGEIQIPYTLKEMGTSVFEASSMSALGFLGESGALLDSIPNRMCFGCSQLTGLLLPPNVETIGSEAFRGCDLQGLELVLPKELKTIGNAAFWETNISSVSIGSDGEGMERIGQYAFYGCTSLQSVSLGSISVIDGGAFQNCTNLAEFAGQAGTIENLAFFGCSALQKYETLSPDTAYIGNQVFDGCSDELFEQNTFMPGLSIVQGWFVLAKSWMMEGVESIDFRDHDGQVFGLSNKFFDGERLTSLQEVHLPNQKCRICSGAFCNFSSARTLRVYVTSPVSFMESSFEAVENLEIYCDTLQHWMDCDFGGIITNRSYKLTIADFSSSTFTVTTEIPAYAFAYASSSWTKVMLERGSHVGEGSFYANGGITDVDTANLLYADDGTIIGSQYPITIGPRAFAACDSLSSVTIHAIYCDTIEELAFADNSALVNLDIDLMEKEKPPCVSSSAFDNCNESIYSYVNNLGAIIESPSDDTPMVRTVKGVIIDRIINQTETYPSYCYDYGSTRWISRVFAHGVWDGDFAKDIYVRAREGKVYAYYDISELFNVTDKIGGRFDGFQECYIDWSRVSADTEREVWVHFDTTSLTKISSAGHSETWHFKGGMKVILGILQLPKWCAIEFDSCSNPLRHGHRLVIQDIDGSEIVSTLTLTGLSRVNSYAFDGCTSFTSVSIGDDVLSMGEYVFRDCNPQIFDLTSKPGLVLVDGWIVGYNIAAEIKQDGRIVYDLTGIRGICEYAFRDASDTVYLTNVPDDLKFNYEAGYNTEGLFDTTSAPGCIIYNNVVMAASTPYKTVIELPDFVTEIYAGAFSGNTTIERIEKQSGTLQIGDGAFLGCTALREVIVNDGVTRTGAKAFYQCSSMVATPRLVGSVGSSAFKECPALTTVTAETYIGSGVFDAGTSITTITIPGDMCDNYSFGVGSVFGTNVKDITLVAMKKWVKTYLNVTEIDRLSIGDGFNGVYLWDDKNGMCWTGENASEDFMSSHEMVDTESGAYHALVVDGWCLSLMDTGASEEMEIQDLSKINEITGVATGVLEVVEKCSGLVFGENLKFISPWAFSQYGKDVSVMIESVEFKGDAPEIHAGMFEDLDEEAVLESIFDGNTKVVVYRHQGTSGWKIREFSCGENRYVRDSSNDADATEEGVRYPFYWSGKDDASTPGVYTETETPDIGTKVYDGYGAEAGEVSEGIDGVWWCGCPLYYKS